MKSLNGWLISGLICLLASCSLVSSNTTDPARESGTIIVVAASSLTDVFTRIAGEFSRANPDIQVEFTFAGSQQLAQQIANGAEVDVFASASPRYIREMDEMGFLEPGSTQEFARNSLVLVTPTGNYADIQSLRDLTIPGIKIILGSVESPIGGYSDQFLRTLRDDPSYGESYYSAVMKNVASYEENVRSVLTKVQLGEADAGIVFWSDTRGGAAKSVKTISIPESENILISYPIAVLKESSEKTSALAFIDYILSPYGQRILEEFGFLPAGN